MKHLNLGGAEAKGIDEKALKSLSANTDNDDEIDWDQIQESLENNVEVDLLQVKKKREAIELRRSIGNKGNKGSILEKAEAAKRKTMSL
jgi:hypothetical protein